MSDAANGRHRVREARPVIARQMLKSVFVVTIIIFALSFVFDHPFSVRHTLGTSLAAVIGVLVSYLFSSKDRRNG